jgi:hypothetical protein
MHAPNPNTQNANNTQFDQIKKQQDKLENRFDEFAALFQGFLEQQGFTEDVPMDEQEQQQQPPLLATHTPSGSSSNRRQ